jgi:ubiquinone/menaquinone biosynthesis C-methylase UbiE
MADGTFQWNSKQYAKANGLQAMVGEQLIRSMRIPDNASILDAGCGSGN